MRWKAVFRGLVAGLLLGLAGVLTPVPSSAADAPPADTSPLVAEWSGGGVTAGEMQTWWSYATPTERKPLNTIDEKQEFLNSLVNAKLMFEKAESLGITQHPMVADFYRGRRSSMTNEKLLTLATQGRVTVNERDLDEVYRKRLTEMELRQIIVAKEEQARALEDSMKAGVPFENLAKLYSVAPTGEDGGLMGTVRWGDFSERFSAEAFRLEPGQVSEPFTVSAGWCILKMDSKTLKEPADPAAEKKDIRTRLERDAVFRERLSYLDSLKTAYDFNLDVNAAVTLSAKYAMAIERTGERTAVLDADIVPELSDAERKVPIVTYRGGALTTGEVADIVANTPFQVRPRLDDADEMVPFITSKASDSLLFVEGQKRGLDKLPEITSQVEKAKRRKTLFAFYDFVTRDVLVPEEEARAQYEAGKQAYSISEGWNISKIVVGTKEAADSVLGRLDRGESFEVIAKARSRDPFTATEGGNVGFLALGQDSEFDGFLATMQPGERKAFRSLEGFVVLWLRQKHDARGATFEEARASVERNLLERRKEEVLGKWISDRRAQLGVRINTDVLQGVVLK